MADVVAVLCTMYLVGSIICCATDDRAPTSRWELACTVTGFRTWSEALKFEYAVRRVGRYQVRRWDLDGRRAAIELLLRMERWSSTSPPASEVPLHVEWHPV